MFRLMFAPKKTPGKGEIHVLDKIYGDFNKFTVDAEQHKLKTSLSPNISNGVHTYEEMIQLEKEGWDIKKLNYTIDRMGNLEMEIPDGYEIVVILK